MKAPKFPYMPAAAAIVSDEDGHSLAIFFPQLRNVSDRDMSRVLKDFLVDLLSYNHITAQSITEEINHEP